VNEEMPRFIAEVSSNHHSDLKRCCTFIERAAEIGCAAVKFQLFRVDELFAPEVLAASSEHRKRRSWELPVKYLKELSHCARQNALEFGCTPFYLSAVEELYPYVDFYKIASYELLWDNLIKACARTGKPLVLSTGMATLDEIARAVCLIRANGCHDLTLLHCVSGYPAPVEQCNLSSIQTLHRTFNVPAGWSDHTVNPAVLFRAALYWKASLVEFHLDLDGTGEEFHTGHCWLPEQIKPVIDTIREGLAADGTGEKIPALNELEERDWRADPKDGLRPLLTKREEWKIERQTQLQ
jgi:N-acetylneuraminate synthase